MKKYSDDDYNDDFNYDDDFDDKDEKMAQAYLEDQELIKSEIDLVGRQINCEILDKAIFIAKGNWRWWFLSNKTKLKLVEEAYHKLRVVLE